MRCMSTEPEGRPKFDEILSLLDDLEVADQLNGGAMSGESSA